MRYAWALSLGLTLAAAPYHARLEAQPQAPPSIHRVTVQADSGVLTIIGTGLGPDLMVMVDGHPVTVLPGASDTRLDVMAPATVLTTPGTYRLTVADAARQRGDGFIVAGPAVPLLPGRDIATIGGARPPRVPTVRASSDLASRRRDLDPSVDPQLTENICGTAVGLNALANNLTKFCGNTAIGREAVYLTTTGLSNTGVGAQALRSNSTGSFNTALGFNAGLDATDGSYNVYLGADVVGTAAETNTMRLGLPYTGSSGQNRTFVAGIHGTALTGPAVQVFVDADGQLGTLTAPVATGTIDTGVNASPRAASETAATIAALRRQVDRLQATDGELRGRIAALEAQVKTLASAVARR